MTRLEVASASVLCAFVAAWASASHAGSAAASPELHDLFVSGDLEDFESFDIPSNSSYVLDCPILDESAQCVGQGPGLVIPGIVITWGEEERGQWNGPGWFGAPSKEIGSSSETIFIDFGVPVEMFGVDLRAFRGYPDRAIIRVFATDDVTQIGTHPPIDLPSSGDPVFVSWEDATGIGRIEVTAEANGWSPMIDNLRFGVPGESTVGTTLTGQTGRFGICRNVTTGQIVFGTRFGAELDCSSLGLVSSPGDAIVIWTYGVAD